MTSTGNMDVGATVVCVRGCIDPPHSRRGETGKIEGFARFSSYHAREAMVGFPDGTSAWFWVRDLEPVQ